MSERYTTYSSFFDFYLSEHSLPATRAIHYVGSACGIIALILTITTGLWWWIPAGLISGYSCAWFGHFFIEHNRPATFKYPLWSFIGDYHMFFLFLTGQLEKRRQRADRHMAE